MHSLFMALIIVLFKLLMVSDIFGFDKWESELVTIDTDSIFNNRGYITSTYPNGSVKSFLIKKTNDLKIQSGCSLTFANETPWEHEGMISGGGSIVVENTSELTLSGLNYYTGGTILKSGILKIASQDNIGTIRSTIKERVFEKIIKGFTPHTISFILLCFWSPLSAHITGGAYLSTATFATPAVTMALLSPQEQWLIEEFNILESLSAMIFKYVAGLASFSQLVPKTYIAATAYYYILLGSVAWNFLKDFSTADFGKIRNFNDIQEPIMNIADSLSFSAKSIISLHDREPVRLILDGGILKFSKDCSFTDCVAVYVRSPSIIDTNQHLVNMMYARWWLWGTCFDFKYWDEDGNSIDPKDDEIIPVVAQTIAKTDYFRITQPSLIVNETNGEFAFQKELDFLEYLKDILDIPDFKGRKIILDRVSSFYLVGMKKVKTIVTTYRDLFTFEVSRKRKTRVFNLQTYSIEKSDVNLSVIGGGMFIIPENLDFKLYPGAITQDKTRIARFSSGDYKDKQRVVIRFSWAGPVPVAFPAICNYYVSDDALEILYPTDYIYQQTVAALLFIPPLNKQAPFNILWSIIDGNLSHNLFPSSSLPIERVCNGKEGVYLNSADMVTLGNRELGSSAGLWRSFDKDYFGSSSSKPSGYIKGAGSVILKAPGKTLVFDNSTSEGGRYLQGNYDRDVLLLEGTLQIPANNVLKGIIKFYDQSNANYTSKSVLQMAGTTPISLGSEILMLSEGYIDLGGILTTMRGKIAGSATLNLINTGAASRISFFNNIKLQSLLVDEKVSAVFYDFVGLTAVSSFGNLIFNSPAECFIYDTISGSGSIEQNGPGVVNLLGDNTYSGITRLSGGILSMKGFSGSSSPSIILNGGSLQIQQDQASWIYPLTLAQNTTSTILGNNSDVTISSVLSGAGNISFRNPSSGFILSGSNTYTGSSQILKDTTLKVSTLNNLGAGALILSGGIFQPTQTLTLTNKPLQLTQGTLSIINTDGVDLTSPVGLRGSGNLRKIGSGVLTVNGSNTHDGLIFVKEGTLSGNVVTAPAIAVDGTYLWNGEVNSSFVLQNLTGGSSSVIKSLNAASLVMQTSATNNFFGKLDSSLVNVSINGNGTQILTGIHAYSGALTINAGSTLQANNLLPLNKAITVLGTLVFNHSEEANYTGTVSGTGSVIQNGLRKLTLTNTTYTGRTTINTGVLMGNISTSTGVLINSLGVYDLKQLDRTLIDLGGTGKVQNAQSSNILTVAIANGSVFSGTLDTGLAGLIISRATANTNAFAFRGVNNNRLLSPQVNSGIFGLMNDSNFAGIKLNGGMLRLDASFSFPKAITFDADSIIDTAGRTLEVANLIGSKKFTKVGNGNVVLPAEITTYTGNVEIKDGAVELMHATGIGAGSLTLSGGALLAGQDWTTPFSKAISLATNTTSFVNSNEDGYTMPMSGVISGAGNLSLTGSGTISLSGANTYTGLTTIGNDVTLSITAGKNIGSSLTIDGGTLQIDSGEAIDLSAQTIKLTKTCYVLLNGGTLKLPSSLAHNNLTLYVLGAGTINFSSSYAGAISYVPGIVLTNATNTTQMVTSGAATIPTGNNTLVINANGGVMTVDGVNTFTGGTEILAGTLKVLNNGALSTGEVMFQGLGGRSTTLQAGVSPFIINNDLDLLRNGFFDINGTTATLSGTIKGPSSRSFTIGDSASTKGSLYLTAESTYEGPTTISSSVVNVTGSFVNTSRITNNGTLVFNRALPDTYNAPISGTGSIEQKGSSILTLASKNNSYTGATTLTSGILSVGSVGTGTFNFNGGILQAFDNFSFRNWMYIRDNVAIHLNGKTVDFSSAIIIHYNKLLSVLGSGTLKLPVGYTGPVQYAPGVTVLVGTTNVPSQPILLSSSLTDKRMSNLAANAAKSLFVDNLMQCDETYDYSYDVTCNGGAVQIQGGKIVTPQGSIVFNSDGTFSYGKNNNFERILMNFKYKDSVYLSQYFIFTNLHRGIGGILPHINFVGSFSLAQTNNYSVGAVSGGGVANITSSGFTYTKPATSTATSGQFTVTHYKNGTLTQTAVTVPFGSQSLLRMTGLSASLTPGNCQGSHIPASASSSSTSNTASSATGSLGYSTTNGLRGCTQTNGIVSVSTPNNSKTGAGSALTLQYIKSGSPVLTQTFDLECGKNNLFNFPFVTASETVNTLYTVKNASGTVVSPSNGGAYSLTYGTLTLNDMSLELSYIKSGNPDGTESFRFCHGTNANSYAIANFAVKPTLSSVTGSIPKSWNSMPAIDWNLLTMFRITNPVYFISSSSQIKAGNTMKLFYYMTAPVYLIDSGKIDIAGKNMEISGCIQGPGGMTFASSNSNSAVAGVFNLTSSTPNTYTGSTVIDSGVTVKGSIFNSVGVTVNGTLDINKSSGGQVIDPSGTGTIQNSADNTGITFYAQNGSLYEGTFASSITSIVIQGKQSSAIGFSQNPTRQITVNSGSLGIYSSKTQAITLNGGDLRVGGTYTLSSVSCSKYTNWEIDNNVLTVTALTLNKNQIKLINNTQNNGSLIIQSIDSLASIITDNSLAVVLNLATNSSTDVVVSGPGSLSIRGGTLTLLSEQDVSGDLTIEANATLKVGDNNDINYRSSIVSNGTLLFQKTSGSYTYEGVVDGTGGVQQSGSNTVILSNVHNYTGNTTITAGTLKISGTIDNSKEIKISSGASFIFSQDFADTYGGVISGAGAANQSGSNILTLSGASSGFTGTVYVNSGSLQLNGTLGGAIVNNSVLIFGQILDVTYSQLISGTGSVIINGAAVLTLSNSNTYSGGTTLNGGTLKVASLNNLGAGLITLNDGIFKLSANNIALALTNVSMPLGSSCVFDTSGGTIDISGSALIQSDIVVIGGGTLRVPTAYARTVFSDGGNVYQGTSGSTVYTNKVNVYSSTTTLSSPISTTNLIFKGSDANQLLTVSSANTYSGAAILLNGKVNIQHNQALSNQEVAFNAISGGSVTLQAGTSGLMLANPFSFLSAATIDTKGVTLTLTGLISGGGALTVIDSSGNNTGKLIVSHMEQYLGALNITSGSLEIKSTLPNHNALAIAGTVIFSPSSSFTYSGAVSGAGSLIIQGVWPLTFNGNFASYTGPLSIKGNTLATNNTIKGDLSLDSGGTLYKTAGDINGNISNNGTIYFVNPYSSSTVLKGDSGSGRIIIIGKTIYFGVYNSSTALSYGSSFVVQNGGAAWFYQPATVSGYVNMVMGNLTTVKDLTLNNELTISGGVSQYPAPKNKKIVNTATDIYTDAEASVNTFSSTIAQNIAFSGIRSNGYIFLLSKGYVGFRSYYPSNLYAKQYSKISATNIKNKGSLLTYDEINNLNLNPSLLNSSIYQATTAPTALSWATNQTISYSGVYGTKVAGNLPIVNGGTRYYNATVSQAPAYGTVSLNGNIFIYDPSEGFYGSDSFVYQIKDGGYSSNNVLINTITINVASPTFTFLTANTFTMGYNTNLSGELPYVTGGWSPYTYLISSQPSYGQVTVNGNDFSYVSDGGYVGIDTFKFKVADSSQPTAAQSQEQTITINILPIGDLNGKDTALNDADSVNFSTTIRNSSQTAPVLTLIAAKNDQIFSGNIQDNISLVKTGVQKFKLAGVYTYTGTTTVTQGALEMTGSMPNTYNILDNATLTFNFASDYLYAGVISGIGEFIKKDANLTTISSAQTYTGLTTIMQGSLKVTGSIASSRGIVNNGTLLYQQGFNETSSQIISGSGSVVQNGSQTLTLSSNHTYQGDTTVNSGTLVLSGANSGAGALIVNGGTLTVLGSNSNARAVNIASGATLGVAFYAGVMGINAPVQNDGTLNFMMQINGGATFDKLILGAGALSVAPINNSIPSTLTLSQMYGTGIVTVSPRVQLVGDLSTASQVAMNGVYNLLGVDRTISDLSGNGVIKSDGSAKTLTVNTVNGSTFSGTLDRTMGGLTVTGSGTFAFNGTNAQSTLKPLVNTGTLKIGANYFSGFTLAGGTLQLTASFNCNAAINVVGNSVLDIKDNNVILSQVLSGGYELKKIGSGTLTISGTSNTRAGNFVVSEGVLSISNANATGLNEAIRLAGGTLKVTSNLTLAQAIILDADSIIDPNGQTLTLTSIQANGHTLTIGANGTLKMATGLNLSSLATNGVLYLSPQV